MVAACVVAKLFAILDCHADVVVFQYDPSEPRCKVNVVVVAFSPTPAELSATVPLKLPGPVPALKLVPSAGEVTDAVTGGVWSRVKVLVAGVA